MTDREPMERIVVSVSANDLFPPETKWREVEGRMAPRSDFYDADPRAKQIRDICVGLTANLARLLWDKSLATDEERQALKAQMQLSGEQLTDMGITANMNTGRKQQTYRRRNPVVFAEYVAGQLLPYTGYSPRSEESVVPLVQEFSVDEGLVDSSEGLSPALEDYYVEGWIVKNAMDFLDCEAEVREQVVLTD